MTWTRLSDDFADSPAVLGLSDAAFRCHVTALIWSNRQLTDGVIPRSAVRLFATDADTVVAELVSAGLWSAGEDSYLLDWSKQETKDRIKKRAEDNALRQERHRRHKIGDHSLCDYCLVKKSHNAGDHSTCVAEYCDARMSDGATSRNALRTPSVTSLPSPSPSPTLREGEGEGREGAAVNETEPSAYAAVSASPTAAETHREVMVSSAALRLVETARKAVGR